MSAFTQSEIDASTSGTVLRNNPGGGSGADYTAICAILEDKNNIGYPLLWQSGDDETAEGFEKHQIGVTCAPDERFAYIVCTEKTNYSLVPDTFSEVSDEIIVHRVFCAALRPTDADFTFANPIKDITVSASTDTVNLQVIALDEYKTVTATNPITVTHAQDFPCVFGIIYKHKTKGEVTEPVPTPPTPVIEPPVLQHTFSFSAPNEVNYVERTFDAGGNFVSAFGVLNRFGGIGIENITLVTREANKKCLRLRISEFDRANSIVHDIVNTEHNLTIGDNARLRNLVTAAGVMRLNATSVIEMTLPMMQHDCALTISYKQIDV